MEPALTNILMSNVARETAAPEFVRVGGAPHRPRIAAAEHEVAGRQWLRPRRSANAPVCRTAPAYDRCSRGNETLDLLCLSTSVAIRSRQRCIKVAAVGCSNARH